MTEDTMATAQQELLETLRGMLEPDGYGVEITSWPETGQGHPRIEIRAQDGACEDCLVPKDIMKLVIADRLPAGIEIDDADLRYPTDSER